MKDSIDNLRDKAQRVAAEAAAHDDADREECRAATALLVGIIDAIKPVLPSLVSRIQSAESGKRRGAKGDESYLKDRGLPIAGLGPRERGKDTGGDIEGDRLYVLEDGVLAWVDYEGEYDERLYAWAAKLELVSPEPAAMTDSLEPLFGRQPMAALSAVAGIIAEALEAQLRGATARRTQEALHRAEYIRAVARILRGATIPLNKPGLVAAKGERK